MVLYQFNYNLTDPLMRSLIEKSLEYWKPTDTYLLNGQKKTAGQRKHISMKLDYQSNELLMMMIVLVSVWHVTKLIQPTTFLDTKSLPPIAFFILSNMTERIIEFRSFRITFATHHCFYNVKAWRTEIISFHSVRHPLIVDIISFSIQFSTK